MKLCNSALVAVTLGHMPSLTNAHISHYLRSSPTRRLNAETCDTSNIKLELSILGQDGESPSMIKYFEQMKPTVKSLRISGGWMSHQLSASDEYHFCWRYDQTIPSARSLVSVNEKDSPNSKRRLAPGRDFEVVEGIVHAALAGDLFSPRQTDPILSETDSSTAGENSTVRLLLVFTDLKPETQAYDNLDVSLLQGHFQECRRLAGFLSDERVRTILNDAGITVVSFRNPKQWAPYLSSWGQDETNAYQLGSEDSQLKDLDFTKLQPFLNERVRESVCKSPQAKLKATTDDPTTPPTTERTSSSPTTTSSSPTTTSSSPTTTSSSPTTTSSSPTTTSSSPTTTSSSPTTTSSSPTTTSSSPTTTSSTPTTTSSTTTTTSSSPTTTSSSLSTTSSNPTTASSSPTTASVKSSTVAPISSNPTKANSSSTVNPTVTESTTASTVAPINSDSQSNNSRRPKIAGAIAGAAVSAAGLSGIGYYVFRLIRKPKANDSVSGA